jgi:trafficking protein particle complex subunit 12
MALCLFYTGRLREAIKLLEDTIFNKKDRQLSHEIVFNLCTLYELESSKAQQKKFNLLLWLNMHIGDGFHEPSLKL